MKFNFDFIRPRNGCFTIAAAIFSDEEHGARRIVSIVILGFGFWLEVTNG